MSNNRRPMAKPMKEPRGKQNPQQLAQQRREIGEAIAAGRRNKKKATERELELASCWRQYLPLIIMGGVGISVAGLALMYAASAPGGVVLRHNLSPATGPSRPCPEPTVPAPPAATFFNPPAKPVVTVNTPSKVRAPAPAPDQVPALGKNVLSLYVTIHQVMTGKGKLQDVHTIITKHGLSVSNMMISIEDVSQAVLTVNIPAFKNIIKVINIKPVHYAFLAQRWDVFALLLAHGANVDDQFTMVVKSPLGDHQETFTTTLSKLHFDFPTCYYAAGICQQKAMHEIFIHHLFQKEYPRAKKMMMHRLQQLRDMSHKWQVSVDDEMVENIFGLLPPVERIKLSLGDLSSSYAEFIADMHFEWAHLQHMAENGYTGFSAYEPRALATVKKLISNYVDCFAWLISKIDPHLTREGYEQRRIQRLLLAYHQFPMTDLKAAYIDSIRTKINDACTREFNGMPVESGPKLITFMLNYAITLLGYNDHAAYRVSLIQVIIENLEGYVRQYGDVNMVEVIAAFNAVKKTGSDVTILQLLNVAIDAVADKLPNSQTLRLK